MAEIQEEVLFFDSVDAFRQWLEENHDRRTELWVGFIKKQTGRQTFSYQESVDAALCYGWIDGIVKTINEERYRQRFTPRKKGSNWSQANIRRVGELSEMGLMHPAGTSVFEGRKRTPAGYTYEERERYLSDEYVEIFRKGESAWRFFEAQPQGYRRQMKGWVMSAKQEETRLRRLEKLIRASEMGKRIEH